MVPKILLTDTSRWSNAARLAVVLSQAGCNVSALCPIPGQPLQRVHALERVFRYSVSRPLESLERSIEAVAPQIIIPCDDRAVRHLHELYEQAARDPFRKNIAALIEKSLGPPEGYPIVSSRYDLLRLAREEGVRVPNTKRVDELADVQSWCREENLPLVLKADGTWGGNGVRIAHTQLLAEASFLNLVRTPSSAAVIKRLLLQRDRFWVRSWLRHEKPAVIAQSYVCGRPANCAALCWEGRLLAFIGVEVVSTQGSECERPATVVRVVDNAEMTLAAQRLAKRLRLSGFFGLDFMIENDSEATYLIEMNPRCTKLTRLQLGQGKNMIQALCAAMSGEPWRVNSPPVPNDLIAYFPEAWNYKSRFLELSFPDIPMGEIDLIRELLRPSSERTLLGQMLDYIRHLRTQRRAHLTRAFAKRLKTGATQLSKLAQEDVLPHSPRI